MVLGNKEICSIRRMEPSSLGIEPFHEEQVGPASYDLRLGDDFIGPGGRSSGKSVWIDPQQFLLASTMEVVTIGCGLCGFVQGRSTWARKGLIVESAGFVDPGFSGQITLELYNVGASSLFLEAGSRIAQIIFHEVCGCTLPYGDKPGAKYMGQKGATAPR